MVNILSNIISIYIWLELYSKVIKLKYILNKTRTLQCLSSYCTHSHSWCTFFYTHTCGQWSPTGDVKLHKYWPVQFRRFTVWYSTWPMKIGSLLCSCLHFITDACYRQSSCAAGSTQIGGVPSQTDLLTGESLNKNQHSFSYTGAVTWDSYTHSPTLWLHGAPTLG